MKIIATENAPKAIGPYSQAIVFRKYGLLFWFYSFKSEFNES